MSSSNGADDDTDATGGGNGEKEQSSEGSGDAPPLLTRVGVAAVVALVVALLVGVVAPSLTASPSNTLDGGVNNSEYAVDDLAKTEIPAKGEISADVQGAGTVVFDEGHANGYDREEIQPLVEAFLRAGYEVVFASDNDLESVLSDAEAYVIVEPNAEFDAEDRAAIRNFTADGGRVALFGEPNRVSVSSGVSGVQVSIDRTTGNRLLAEYGLAFRTDYVYNQQTNDGGFKNPIAEPVGPASDAGDRVPVYTAAHVAQLDQRGEVVLRAPAGSRTSASDVTGRFPLAVRSGNLLAVGDTSLLEVGRYNVADNEEFLGFVVRYLLSSERAQPTPTPTATPTATPTGNETVG